jgi:uncharacterized protein with ATP-grasp and redox domains
MRTHIECFPCFVRQTIIALSQFTKDPAVHEEIVREVLSLMQRTNTSRPVLNDVTAADAIQAGLIDVCEVIDNGSDAIGTILEWTSPEFQRQYRAAELIIIKGQGNFETLTGNAKKTYFLFQSKCDMVSKELGLSPGSMLLKTS